MKMTYRKRKQGTPKQRGKVFKLNKVTSSGFVSPRKLRLGIISALRKTGEDVSFSYGGDYTGYLMKRGEPDRNDKNIGVTPRQYIGVKYHGVRNQEEHNKALVEDAEQRHELALKAMEQLDKKGIMYTTKYNDYINIGGTSYITYIEIPIMENLSENVRQYY